MFSTFQRRQLYCTAPLPFGSMYGHLVQAQSRRVSASSTMPPVQTSFVPCRPRAFKPGAPPYLRRSTSSAGICKSACATGVRQVHADAGFSPQARGRTRMPAGNAASSATDPSCSNFGQKLQLFAEKPRAHSAPGSTWAQHQAPKAHSASFAPMIRQEVCRRR